MGYSFFGKIAFEAARELQGAGGNVACVILVDAFARSAQPLATAGQSLQWIWRNVSRARGISYLVLLRTLFSNIARLGLWLLVHIPHRARGPILACQAAAFAWESAFRRRRRQRSAVGHDR